MDIRGMRRVAALVILTALALSPALPVTSACFAACGRTASRTAHACCRPRSPGSPLTMHAPNCCRTGTGGNPSTVTTGIEPAAKASATLAACAGPVVATKPASGVAVLAFVRDESPPAPPPFRAVLRI